MLTALAQGRIRADARRFFALLFGVRPVLGTFYQTRGPREDLEDALDQIYVREDRENFWAPRYGAGKDADELRIDGKVAIVGKGPDLDLISSKHLDGVTAVFCINDSVHRIEQLDTPLPLYAVQGDSDLKDRCRPKRGRMIVALCAAHNYRSLPDKIVFSISRTVYEIRELADPG